MAATSYSLHSASPNHDVDYAVRDGTTARRGNALSNKLTSVLSWSYADTEIRDALHLYDTRYVDGNLDKDLDLKHESQREVIEANARIIDDFSKVATQLNRVGALIATLNQTCDDIRQHVLAAKQETAPMLEEASTLLKQKRENEQKQQLLDSFCKHFLISDEDLTTLTSSAETLNERFFEVLGRVKQIHEDCELLLGYENQRLGLELMEQTTRNLNAGYKKLFSWTLREFKGLDLEDPHISGSIRRSLRALSERPALFQSCLDSFAEARQSTVSDAFQKALTDSSMGAARAIDFSTHDPLRYIGDMLAWVHSATVSEMEALEGLFISDEAEISRGLHQGKAEDPFAMPTGEDGEEVPFDGHAALNSLISRNMASVSHTLTQRISVTVRNLSDSVEIYKAYNVLSFYHDMFLKLIRHSTTTTEPQDPNDNTILSTLNNLQNQTFHHFEMTTLETLHASIDDTPKSDLSPPTALSETLSAFTKITQTRGPALSLQEFTKLYSTLLAPLLTSCADLATLASEASGATPATPLVYKLNYMSLVRDTLKSLTIGSSPIEAASQPLQYVEQEIVLTRTRLTELLRDTFTETSGLDDLHTLENLNPHDHPTPSASKKRKHVLQRTPASTATNGGDQEFILEVLAAKLDSFLASALMDAQDELGKLVDKSISAFVTATAVKLFCEVFEELVGGLEEVDEAFERERLARRMGKGLVNGEGGSDGEEDDEEGDDSEEPLKLRDLYPRTVEEVQALLS